MTAFAIVLLCIACFLAGLACRPKPSIGIDFSGTKIPMPEPRFKAGDWVYSCAHSKPLRVARTYIHAPRIVYDFYGHAPELPEKMLSLDSSFAGESGQNHYDDCIQSFGYARVEEESFITLHHRKEWKPDTLMKVTPYDVWRLASMCMEIVEGTNNYQPKENMTDTRESEPTLVRKIGCPGYWSDEMPPVKP